MTSLAGAQKIFGKCFDVNSRHSTEIKLKPKSRTTGLNSPSHGKGGTQGRGRRLTSLSPSVSSSRSRMVLKCSSQTPRLSSRVILSSSSRAPFRSSTRSLWLDSSFRRSATKSEWSMGTGETPRQSHLTRTPGCGRALRPLSTPRGSPPPSFLPRALHPCLLPAHDTLSRPSHQTGKQRCGNRCQVPIPTSLPSPTIVFPLRVQTNRRSHLKVSP